MLRSLVGSEMCIRDSPRPHPCPHPLDSEPVRVQTSGSFCQRAVEPIPSYQLSSSKQDLHPDLVMARRPSPGTRSTPNKKPALQSTNSAAARAVTDHDRQLERALKLSKILGMPRA
eukprot:TRINITY_DN14857_c0_g1_i1.p1 TRINITY_DN14857_c0_g1~~TRINITY_DN14857_c0_g1_i1.p1  ORF type:complete len:129 (+),score=28.81 TRINITY_DN14857_c0_g1_i1:42-389(+)